MQNVPNAASDAKPDGSSEKKLYRICHKHAALHHSYHHCVACYAGPGHASGQNICHSQDIYGVLVSAVGEWMALYHW